MSEEIGLPEDSTNVLGILRCNWGEISAITGIAVTPVVGYVGNLGEDSLNPNKDEVEEVREERDEVGGGQTQYGYTLTQRHN